MMKNSIKLILVTALVFWASSGLHAQESVILQGDKVINFGMGVGSYLGGAKYSVTIPQMSGSFEYCVKDDLFDEYSALGLGGYMAYTANKFEHRSGEGVDYSYFLLGARLNYHHQFVEKLDTYAGILYGYKAISSSAYGGYDGDLVHGEFIPAVFVGGRYYLFSGFSLFAELGYGISALEFGLSFKF
jgi:hypothetical protein